MSDTREWLEDVNSCSSGSLRDELERAVGPVAADHAIAIFQRHVEKLTRDGRDFDGYIPEEAWEAGRDDVLRLLAKGEP